MRTFVTAPQADGNWPGIVFYTDIFQLTEASLRWAVRLAAYGFLVAVPEIYHRVEPPDTVLAFDDEGKARGQADVEAITTAEFDEDIDAALTWLAARGAPVGASGHCTGGHLGFRAAFDARVDGTALWYPTGLHNGKLGEDESDALARAGEIGRELLLIFGTRDPHTPPPGRATVMPRWMRRARAISGTSTTPSTRSGATSARASTPRRPTPRSPRPSRSSGGRCDPLRPPGVGELPQGADPARAPRRRL